MEHLGHTWSFNEYQELPFLFCFYLICNWGPVGFTGLTFLPQEGLYWQVGDLFGVISRVFLLITTGFNRQKLTWTPKNDGFQMFPIGISHSICLFSGAMLYLICAWAGCRGDICSCGFLSPRPMRQGYLGQIHGFIQEDVAHPINATPGTRKWMFPKIGVPQKKSILIGLFHYKPKFWGVSLYLETPKSWAFIHGLWSLLTTIVPPGPIPQKKANFFLEIFVA